MSLAHAIRVITRCSSFHAAMDNPTGCVLFDAFPFARSLRPEVGSSLPRSLPIIMSGAWPYGWREGENQDQPQRKKDMERTAQVPHTVERAQDESHTDPE